MLVTEEQGKTTACPQGLGEPFSITALGRTYHGCIGSRCMWWRWQTAAFFSVSWGSGHDGRSIGTRAKCFGSLDREGGTTLNAYASADEKSVGYCGMAGKP